ncbi:polysaccharide deacetylase family protein [Roseateles paludis]|jgi:peptidoglycan/xylan/chitin deacetylase (PgdA/CDA1 family)|uniref:Polysaccharide deacetylase family protein n=1 Tax=Roseateles paludis TaxID=3145238 RepID=A0ABV0G340_9BURK
MRKKFSLVVAALAVSLLAPAWAGDWAWPKGAQAAVSLGYDDGLASQLDTVIPALNQRHLKASFYLPINAPTVPARLPEWRRAAKAGHELGNHSLFHACSASQPARDWVPAHHDLDKILPAQVQEQVIAANVWLHSLDGKTQRTFTPPCLELSASGQDFGAALRKQFVAYRGASEDLIDDPAKVDPYAVPTIAVEGYSAERLIALVDEAAAKHSMVVLLFHGVGGEYLNVTREAHAALLDHLAKHRQRFWTDSFVNIMSYVKARQGKN